MLGFPTSGSWITEYLEWIRAVSLTAGLASIAGMALTVYAFAAAWRARWEDEPR